tara:strand:- start:98 stop:688 length:591 start_codon:yes stop_codon:yes gene_type:complete
MSDQEFQGKVEFKDDVNFEGNSTYKGNQKHKATRAAGNTSSHLDGASGVGVHEYYEVVTLTTADDDDVAVSLSKKLPAGCVIIDAGLVVVEIATSQHGNVALEVHSAAIADDEASGGTEIVGADVSGDKSIPDADLDASSDGVVGEAVSMGTLGAVDRATAETFFHVVAKENLSSMTGTPKVGVYVKWLGKEAVDI